jgi:RNA polymerase sigma-70 factor (ECF subfamily)
MNRPDIPAPSGRGPAGDDEEAALLDRISEGELTALETLYDRYRGIAYGLALRITADTQLAEDVVQDAFLGVWRQSGRYTPSRASVRTWLLSIVHHRAIDVVRRRRPTTALPDGDGPVDAAFVTVDPWPEVVGRLDRESIRSALATLSDVQREAIELAYFGGLTHQEIAQRTGAPLGTVKSRVRLGLLGLREVLVTASGVADRAGGAA